MRPRIVLLLIMCLVRQHLEDPPAPGHLQLVIDRRQGIKQVLLLLIDKRLLEFDGLLVVLREIEWLVVLVRKTVGGVRDSRGSRDDVRIDGIGVHAYVLEHVFVEKDAGAEDEALADHPAQGDPCKVMAGSIGNRSTTDI
jgi:hypothetical protein